MTRREAGQGLDFEALRRAIERCDPDLVLSFYAEDARLSIVNAAVPQAPPFELRGKAEIAKHLRTVLGQETSHRVEREVIGEERVTFREACEYPDGSLVLVATTLEVSGGRIFRQVDVVANAARAARESGIDQGPPARETHQDIHSGVEAPASDRLRRSEHATGKEDPR